MAVCHKRNRFLGEGGPYIVTAVHQTRQSLFNLLGDEGGRRDDEIQVIFIYFLFIMILCVCVCVRMRFCVHVFLPCFA